MFYKDVIGFNPRPNILKSATLVLHAFLNSSLSFLAATFEIPQGISLLMKSSLTSSTNHFFPKSLLIQQQCGMTMKLEMGLNYTFCT